MCLTFAPLTGVTQWGLCSVYSLPQRWGSVSRTRRGGSCDNAPGICSLCLWCRCDHFASRLLYSWLSRAYHGVEKAKLRNHLQFSRSDESQTGKVSVWVSLRFSVVCLTRPGVSAVARGIFIISNLLRQKTDTNTILASHGVMSSLVKLFSVKFHPLTKIARKYCGSKEFMEWVQVSAEPSFTTSEILLTAVEKNVSTLIWLFYNLF